MFLLAQSSFVRCVSEQSCPAPVRSTASSGSQVYESSRAVSEYLLFHYGDDRDMMPYSFGPKDALGFTQRLADLGKDHSSQHGRALDIGCSVGGAAFHLSKHFDEVVGIDFSNHFVDAANIMKRDGRMSYQIMEQGQLFSSRDARLPVGAKPERVRFEQGDATNLKKSLGKFDLILASNLLCRLPSPRAFLESVPHFLNPGGTLLLVSPYSWLDEYTPVNEWMGAKDGKRSYDEIQRYISEKGLPLVQAHREDIPFLIREHERKFQYGVSDAVAFTRS
jgi:putative 4-mercaptohistidine N1-methyltranferase